MDEKYQMKAYLESNPSDSYYDDYKYVIPDPPSNKDNPQLSIKPSSCIHLYNKYIYDKKIVPYIQDMYSFKKQFYYERITYNPYVFCSSPTIILKSHSTNHQVMHLSVSFSHFTCEIDIINSEYSSCALLQNTLYIAKGNMGYVRKTLTRNGEEFAIKIIKYKTNCNFYQSVKSVQTAIIEFAMNKVFSTLKIGPHVGRYYLGFDIVMYYEHIIFASELCDNLTEINSNYQILMSKLLTMHYFKIIHGDLKPHNIMFSKKYKYPIFIDFGISRPIPEYKGSCTLTQFFGTYHYCSIPMKNLFYNYSFGILDLYHNDFHCLQLSIKYMKKDNTCSFQKKINVEQSQSQAEKLKIINYIYNLKFMNILLMRNKNYLVLYLDDIQGFEIYDYTLAFFGEIGFFGKDVAQLVKKKFNLDYKYEYKLQDIETNNNKIIFVENKKKNQKFKKRLKYIYNNQSMSANDLVLCLHVFYEQDVGTKARLLKYYYRRNITNFSFYSHYFWENVINFSKCLFTEKKYIVEVFNYIGKKLSVKFHEYYYPLFDIYSRSWKIIEFTKKKFGIDLFGLTAKHKYRDDNNIISEVFDFYRILKISDYTKDFSSYSLSFEMLQRMIKIIRLYISKRLTPKILLSRLEKLLPEIYSFKGLAVALKHLIFYLRSSIYGSINRADILYFEQWLQTERFSEKIAPFISLAFRKLYNMIFYDETYMDCVIQELDKFMKINYNQCFDTKILLHIKFAHKIYVPLLGNSFTFYQFYEYLDEIYYMAKNLVGSYVGVFHLILLWCFKIAYLSHKIYMIIEKNQNYDFYSDQLRGYKMYMSRKIKIKVFNFLRKLVILKSRLTGRDLLSLISFCHIFSPFKYYNIDEKYEPNEDILFITDKILNEYPTLPSFHYFSSSYDYFYLLLKNKMKYTDNFLLEVTKLQKYKYNKIKNRNDLEFYYELIYVKNMRKLEIINELRYIYEVSVQQNQRFDFFINFASLIFDYISIKIKIYGIESCKYAFSFYMGIIKSSYLTQSENNILEFYLNEFKFSCMILQVRPNRPLYVSFKYFLDLLEPYFNPFKDYYSNILPFLYIMLSVAPNLSIYEDNIKNIHKLLLMIYKCQQKAFSFAKWRLDNRINYFLYPLWRKDVLTFPFNFDKARKTYLKIITNRPLPRSHGLKNYLSDDNVGRRNRKIYQCLLKKMRNSQYALHDSYFYYLKIVRQIINQDKGVTLYDKIRTHPYFLSTLVRQEEKLSQKLQHSTRTKSLPYIDPSSKSPMNQFLANCILNDEYFTSRDIADFLLKDLSAVQHVLKGNQEY